ncbi:hypothetical protein O181_025967 [Austropuccinia psidii MF-1]|uniref:Uncharacterized protein n=1 Tax=Austropuccinia psidii MF-1 TaxID=1389203 RepID=A0A9Q3H0D3_9BASI|nr:hypothetical protein [Austropuccinia psidii MF-1]
MAEPNTSAARDIIVHASRTPSSPYHIFFLPGNPGLVEYYAGFLESLHQSLNKDESSPGFHVSGCSFAGFETTTTTTIAKDCPQIISIPSKRRAGWDSVKMSGTLTPDLSTAPANPGGRT